MSKSAPQKRSFPIVWIVVGAVVVLGVVAIALSVGGGDDDGGGGGGSSGAEFGDPTISGEALPSYVSGTEDAAVGETAPTVRGENFDGEPTSIEPGKPRMIVFLAHWCPHCNAEAPRLAAFLADPGLPDGVELTIVPTGSQPEAEFWPPSEWLNDVGLGQVETLVDSEDQTVAAAYGLSAYPFIVTLDADGRVLERVSGEQPEGFFDETFAELAAS
jgi:cytochrome c biogenesis protein CcmG, thiol:disulfide interchange protein DsbE